MPLLLDLDDDVRARFDEIVAGIRLSRSAQPFPDRVAALGSPMRVLGATGAAQRSTEAPKSAGTASMSTMSVGRPRLIRAPRRTPMRRKPARS
jgi:hypothetical protein